MKKNIFVSFLMVLSIFLAFTSCKDTEEATPALLVEDGLYVYGDGTALTTYAGSGLMKATKNEVGGVDRPGLYELYIAVKASGGFNIANVVAGKATILSPGADFKEVLAAAKDAEEPATYFARGGFAEGTTQFKVPTDGLYHVVYDRDLKKVVVAKVEWGIIGGATPQGWGSSTPLPGGTFDSKMMTFEAKDVILTNDKFKFRYGNNWKIILDGALVRVNCNFGGAVDALVPGGADIANTVTGKYTVTIKWELGKGTTATLVKTGD